MARDLIAVMKKKEKAGRKKRKDRALPEYGPGGKVQRRRRKPHKVLYSILGVVCALILAIYAPALYDLITQEDDSRGAYFTTPNAAALKAYNDYSQAMMTEDFDGDGLTNEQENRYNTSPRRMDTDGDGVSDYAELFVYGTSPTKADNTLYEAFVEQDRANGDGMDAPYKIGNVVLWADSYRSKAYGCVVQTLRGYRFTGFSGWAEFPEGRYAYEIQNGKHVALEKREVENVWRIDTTNEVVLYDEPLQMTHRFTLADNTWYLEDNFIGRVLSFLLPDQGWLTCEQMALADTWEDADEAVTAPIVKIAFDETDGARYGRNQNTLQDLAEVYALLREGDSVLVALNSVYDGEIIAEIYGYDPNGNLLIADAQTLKPVGVLNIEPKASRMIDAEGGFTQYEYFDFYGLGFDSRAQFDTIAFLAAAVDGGDTDEEQLEPTPEPTLAPTPEPTPEPTPAPATQPAEGDAPDEPAGGAATLTPETPTE